MVASPGMPDGPVLRQPPPRSTRSSTVEWGATQPPSPEGYFQTRLPRFWDFARRGLQPVGRRNPQDGARRVFRTWPPKLPLWADQIGGMPHLGDQRLRNGALVSFQGLSGLPIRNKTRMCEIRG